jgi:tetratricopeptide (TPR) repeat protein
MAKKATTRSKGALPSRKRLARKSSDRPEGYAKAVEAFEKGLKSLHKGDLDRARNQFQDIVSEYARETEIVDRALAYLTVCDRQPKSTFSPRTFEESVAYGVFCHNRGDYDRAIKYLTKALEMEPGNDHVHYCLAAAYSCHGDREDAKRHLKQAVSADQYNRVLAKADADFAVLRDEADVSQLLTPSE